MSWVRSIGAHAFIVSMTLAGCICFGFSFAHWQSSDPVKFVCYLIAALLASSLKVTLPGIQGTLSVNFLFTLLGILELSLPETLLIVLACTLGQAYWRPAKQVKVVQLAFNWAQTPHTSWWRTTFFMPPDPSHFSWLGSCCLPAIRRQWRSSLA
jgi:hypothetical protein